MPVPAAITDLNVSAGSNSPAGSESVFPNLDDYLRALSSFIAQLNANKAALASPTFTGTVTAPTFAGALTGNASTATSAATATTANGVAWTNVSGRPTAVSAFTNDAGYITSVGAAAAGSLTGTTLAAGVTASSLTSFGAGMALGTPASGNLANCTFPTLNQNTTGSAASVSGASSNGYGTRTVSTSAPSGAPATGDVWMQYV